MIADRVTSSQYNASQKPMNSSQNNRPHHVDDAATDVASQISVYSSNRTDWTEVKALFVTDLEECGQNWISEDLVKRLQLNRTFNVDNLKEYGRLELRTFQFQGLLTLQWTEKGGHKSKFTPCRIVPRTSFDVLLRSSLLNFEPSQKKPPLDQEISQMSLPPSLEDPSIVAQDDSSVSSTGSFDGLQPLKVIEDHSDEAISADKWLSNFDRSVLKSIRKLPERTNGSSNPPRVKIAILDTGIDVYHPSIIGAMCSGRISGTMQSFVGDDDSTKDECGHGTHIAALLSKVAPQAEIYIAKIAKTQEIPLNHNITTAIRWATELKVDIITMSFGLEKHDNGMQDAILEAYHQNIIMFSAASNQGGNFGVKYPARTNEVLCIYSTDGMGEPSGFNPTKMKGEGHHFATLGEGIKSAWPKSLGNGSAPHQRMSGTSFAVPLAAGTAACVLEFALRNGMKTSHESLYKKLRSRQGMHIIFSELLAENRKEFHYIHPWMLFAIGDSDCTGQYILDRIKYVIDRY